MRICRDLEATFDRVRKCLIWANLGAACFLEVGLIF
jgi:hypothetical protein